MTSCNVHALDYPKAQILMKAVTQTEKEFRLRACAKEPWTVGWIEAMKPGEWMYDVGASTGPYTLLAAKLGMQVVAVEPHPASAARLLENVVGNALSDRITCLCLALDHANGPMRMRYVRLDPGATSVSSRMLRDPDFIKGGGDEQQLADHHTLSLSLDTLVFDCGFPVPNYIKLDIDEGEERVMRGGMECLTHPEFKSLMVEVAPDARDAIFGVAREAGLVVKGEYAERRGFDRKWKIEPYVLFTKPEYKYD